MTDMIEFQTEPSRYRHWRVSYEGDVARVVMDVDETGGLFDGYELKLNSYDLGVDIELFDAVQRLDVSNPRGPHHARLMPPGVFPSEVAFVPKRRKDEEKAEKREEEGYLVYLEYDASRHASDVVVLDAGDVAGAEIARVALPFHVPHTFHGEFEPSER